MRVKWAAIRRSPMWAEGRNSALRLHRRGTVLLPAGGGQGITWCRGSVPSNDQNLWMALGEVT